MAAHFPKMISMPTKKGGFRNKFGMTTGKFGMTAGTVVFCLGIILIGVLIQVFSTAKGDSVVFPSLLEILKSFFRLLVSKSTYLSIANSFFHLLAALFFSTVLGIFLGLLEGFFDFFQKFFRPLMMLLRSLPMIVAAIIIMVITKYEKVPYIAATIALLPLISEATSEGVRSIDSDLIDAYRLYSNFSPRILFTVYLPLMSGFFKQAYLNALGMGLKIVITSEYLVQAKNSLGKAVFTSAYFNEYAEVYAYALVMVLVIMILSALPHFLLAREQ